MPTAARGMLLSGARHSAGGNKDRSRRRRSGNQQKFDGEIFTVIERNKPRRRRNTISRRRIFGGRRFRKFGGAYRLRSFSVKDCHGERKSTKSGSRCSRGFEHRETCRSRRKLKGILIKKLSFSFTLAVWEK